LQAGQASFHHPLMLHGSYENTSNRMRRAAVVNFVRDGVTSDSDQPLLDGVPVIPPGAKIEGQFFPSYRNKVFDNLTRAYRIAKPIFSLSIIKN
jgi:hypothetical protein